MLRICVNYDVCECLFVQYKYNITLYNLIIKKWRRFFFFYMCVYCYHIIITFCNKVVKFKKTIVKLMIVQALSPHTLDAMITPQV